MTFFVSYPISTQDSHISLRAEGPRADMGRGLIWGMIRKMSYHNPFIICFLLLLFCLSICWQWILNSSFAITEWVAVAAINSYTCISHTLWTISLAEAIGNSLSYVVIYIWGMIGKMYHNLLYFFLLFNLLTKKKKILERCIMNRLSFAVAAIFPSQTKVISYIIAPQHYKTN